MIIKDAILHIMDFASDVCVFSEQRWICRRTERENLSKNTSRFIDDSAAKEGNFSDYSIFKQTLKKYAGGSMDFTSLSAAAGNLLYDQLSRRMSRSGSMFCSAVFPKKAPNT